MKKKATIIVMLMALGICSVLFFKPFAKTEIFVLDQMTEYRDDIPNQICLVINPPGNSKKLHKLIEDFNNQNQAENGLFERLFIKEHDYELPILPWADNVDYRLETTSRNDLQNVDFLGESSARIYRGDTIRNTQVYVGKIWYYNK